MFKTLIDLLLLLAIFCMAATGFLLLSANSPLCVVALLASALLVWLRQLWIGYEEGP